jgi:hypothetical protein
LENNIISRLLALVAWSLLAVTSSGLAAKPTIPTSDTDGYVLARVVINAEGQYRQHVNYFTGYYSQLILQASARPELNYYVPVPSDVAADGWMMAIHAMRLPAGKYKLVGFGNENGLYRAFWLTDDILPEIEISSRHVTDLGTIVLQPTGPIRGIVVPWPGNDSYDRTSPSVLAAIASIGANVPVDNWHGENGWIFKEGQVIEGGTLLLKLLEDKPRPDIYWGAWSKYSNFDETIARIRAATTWMGEASETDEAAWFGSNLGQVLRRSRDGHWSIVETGLSSPIASVLSVPGHIFAAARDGRLLDSTDDGQTWRVSDARISGGVARVILHDSGEFFLLSAGLAQTDVSLYRNRSFMELTNSSAIALPKYRRLSAIVKPLSMQATKDRVWVWLPPSIMATYELGTNEMTTSVTNNLGELAAALGGEVLYSRNSWYLNKGVFSRDSGLTWQSFKWGSVYSLGYGFRDHTQAVGVHLKPGLVAGKFFSVASRDAGKSWQRVGQAPECSEFRWLEKADRGLCFLGDGTIYSTFDGTKWTLERSVR